LKIIATSLNAPPAEDAFYVIPNVEGVIVEDLTGTAFSPWKSIGISGIFFHLG
jgi:hypothetical protein